MHDTIVKMKDGRTFCGPIWENNWRAKRPYITIPSDEEAPDKIYFDEMESCITKDERTGIDPETRQPIIEDHDLIAQMRKNREEWPEQLEKSLDMLVIYWNTKDYPDKYVVRRWLCTTPEPTPMEIVHENIFLRQARKFIKTNYPDKVQMRRHPTDDPVIVETWI